MPNPGREDHRGKDRLSIPRRDIDQKPRHLSPRHALQVAADQVDMHSAHKWASGLEDRPCPLTKRCQTAPGALGSEVIGGGSHEASTPPTGPAPHPKAEKGQAGYGWSESDHRLARPARFGIGPATAPGDAAQDTTPRRANPQSWRGEGSQPHAPQPPPPPSTPPRETRHRLCRARPHRDSSTGNTYWKRSPTRDTPPRRGFPPAPPGRSDHSPLEKASKACATLHRLPLCSLPGGRFPPSHDDVAIAWVDLNQPRPPAQRLTRHKRRPRPRKRIHHHVAPPRRVPQKPRQKLDRLGRRMITRRTRSRHLKH